MCQKANWLLFIQLKISYKRKKGDTSMENGLLDRNKEGTIIACVL